MNGLGSALVARGAGGLTLGTLGLIAAYFSKVDNVIMRLMDIMLSLPGILLAIAIVAALGPGVYEVMIAVGIGYIAGFARLMRGSVLAAHPEGQRGFYRFRFASAFEGDRLTVSLD